MAYMSQEHKKQLAPTINAILKKYGVKGTLAVRHYSTLILNIKSSSIDFFGDCTGQRPTERDCMTVNHYWYKEHFTGESLAFLSEVIPAMNLGNHNNSDIMTDYFDVGWYMDVNIGQWDKPYQLLELA